MKAAHRMIVGATRLHGDRVGRMRKHRQLQLFFTRTSPSLTAAPWRARAIQSSYKGSPLASREPALKSATLCGRCEPDTGGPVAGRHH